VQTAVVGRDEKARLSTLALRQTPKEATEDLAWALINSPGFSVLIDDGESPGQKQFFFTHRAAQRCLGLAIRAAGYSDCRVLPIRKSPVRRSPVGPCDAVFPSYRLKKVNAWASNIN
jgi:hypothetical protein